MNQNPQPFEIAGMPVNITVHEGSEVIVLWDVMGIPLTLYPSREVAEAAAHARYGPTLPRDCITFIDCRVDLDHMKLQGFGRKPTPPRDPNAKPIDWNNL